MGNPRAGNVLKSGVSMTVFDLHAPAMKNLIDAGAKPAASAAEVVERCEIVLTCLPASPDVEAAYLEPGGLVERAKPGNVLVDLSSVLPSTPRKIEPRAKARGVHFLESPVSGGGSGALAGTPALMVGGAPARLARGHARPHGGRRSRGARSRAVRAARHGPEYLPRGAGRGGQYREGDQQHDGLRQLARDDGRGRARREGGARSHDGVRGREGEQRRQQGARANTLRDRPAQLRARIQ